MQVGIKHPHVGLYSFECRVVLDAREPTVELVIRNRSFDKASEKTACGVALNSVYHLVSLLVNKRANSDGRDVNHCGRRRDRPGHSPRDSDDIRPACSSSRTPRHYTQNIRKGTASLERRRTYTER